MTETLSRGSSGGNDFSERLAYLMREAGKENTPAPDSEAEKWEASPDEMPIVPESAAAESDPVTLNGGTEVTENNDTFTSVHDPGRELTYEQLMREMATPAAERDALYAEESTVTVATSRIGRFLQRNANRADRASELATDSKEYAKTKLRGAGRAALRASKATAEVAGRAATATGELGAGVGIIARDKAEDVLNNTLDAVGGAIEKKVTSVKEKLVERKTAALARRQARRERWGQRWTSAKESVKNGYDKTKDVYNGSIDKTLGGLDKGADYIGDKMVSAKDKATDKVERGRAAIAATRALGRAAIDARQ